MEMIHLDTNFLIRIAVPASKEDLRLRQWLQSGIPVATSAICWAEFLCGPVTGNQIASLARAIGEPVPFTVCSAHRAADLFKTSGRIRGTFVDCMIAATALEAGARLATSNVKDFVPFRSSGLQVEPV